MNSKTDMSSHYDFHKIDSKWQKRWDEAGIYKTQSDKKSKNWYELTMYPYPSGDLHVGHWYAMAPYDAHVRYQRMKGLNVLAPMGFDAFGLPAENAAIKEGVHPFVRTMENIKNMRNQLGRMGTVFDWSREIICCTPDYYRWNQWLFLQFYKKGLAYKEKAPANWCPSCQTVLANEQVIDGQCERCEAIVTCRDLEQWFFRITEYAEELLDFNGLIDWPDKILTMQRNWIGRSEGVYVKFDIGESGLSQKDIVTFTTRIDTIFGVTFIVLAPEHPLVNELTIPEKKKQVESYVEHARRQTELERLSNENEKTGVFLGTYAINTLSGARVPIFIADYALLSYGTGAVMGVPAHDQRDFTFAQKFKLPITTVISPVQDPGDLSEAYVDDGMMVNSEQFNGLKNQDAKDLIADFIEEKDWGKRGVSYRLRDWLISRQRYWGTPIPIIYCDDCGVLPVDEKSLPVMLPPDADFNPTGESPLARNPEFVKLECHKCGGNARRETDTMDTFVDSSWYQFRFVSPHYKEGPFDPIEIKNWGPVDQYTGGVEHAILHLLYARFVTKALRDLRLLDFSEPFVRLFSQGTIISEGMKMSKSRGNVINPDDYVAKLGADVVRTYLMFIGPWDQGGEWNDSGINGVARWLNRVWEICQRDISELSGPCDGDATANNLRILHKTIRKVNQDLSRFKFNTAIASMMEFSNYLGKVSISEEIDRDMWKLSVETLLLLLAPIAPHTTEELWERNGNKFSIHEQSFPKWNDALTKENLITMVVQVDGKVRDQVEMVPDISEEESTDIVMARSKVKKHVGGRDVIRIIHIPNRLINVVTK